MRNEWPEHMVVRQLYVKCPFSLTQFVLLDLEAGQLNSYNHFGGLGYVIIQRLVKSRSEEHGERWLNVLWIAIFFKDVRSAQTRAGWLPPPEKPTKLPTIG